MRYMCDMKKEKKKVEKLVRLNVNFNTEEEQNILHGLKILAAEQKKKIRDVALEALREKLARDDKKR